MYAQYADMLDVKRGWRPCGKKSQCGAGDGENSPPIVVGGDRDNDEF